jgi:PTS system fructose-specific IIC component
MPLLLIVDLHSAGPLLTLAIVILVGMVAGGVARRLHLPGITGQILAGVALGAAGLNIFGLGEHGVEKGPLEAIQPLTHFALGLMAATVGAHLNLRRLRNAGRRLGYLLLFEATLTPLLVFGIMKAFGGVATETATLFAASAIATAPATIVACVAESRAKGVFVKTLVGGVALNNMACIILFEVARAAARTGADGLEDLDEIVGGPALQILVSLGIGGSIALLMEVVARYVVHTDRLATAAVVGLVLTSGLASYFDASPLLACLLLGFVQTNITRTRDTLLDTVFSDFQPAILAVFFTLAGLHLSFEHAALAGALSALLLLGRAAGKYVSADLAMRMGHATAKVRRNLGIALVPQAGVAVALVILIQDDPAFAGEVSSIFSAVVLTVVTANEIIGPLLVRMALRRTGEAGMDRMRLMDFLQEENIVTDFTAPNKRDAIEKLVDLLIDSHHLKDINRQELLESVLLRESQASTCLGGGLSVPHGILPDGRPMVGVMALSRAGLDFPTPDHRRVHCMVLLGTSRDERDRHLQVLATLARTIGTDEAFQAVLFNAKNAAHASELLHGEESVGFNTFLEDDA